MHPARRRAQLQAFFLVADDIMDGSITRRGQPCWYKQSKVRGGGHAVCVERPCARAPAPAQLPPTRRVQVGLIACNDYILIECCIYRIIKHHFGGHPSYVQLMEIFHEVRTRSAPPPLRQQPRATQPAGAAFPASRALQALPAGSVRRGRARASASTPPSPPPSPSAPRASVDRSAGCVVTTQAKMVTTWALTPTLARAQVTFQTSHGQLLDLITAAPGGKVGNAVHNIPKHGALVLDSIGF